jgi:hypothetical protein
MEYFLLAAVTLWTETVFELLHVPYYHKRLSICIYFYCRVNEIPFYTDILIGSIYNYYIRSIYFVVLIVSYRAVKKASLSRGLRKRGPFIVASNKIVIYSPRINQTQMILQLTCRAGPVLFAAYEFHPNQWSH